ncbi:MAG: winged helix-turn-helix domain-containing protein [Acholeplasmataceae bacterium]|jgi:DNA-binding Lrp family transcriptional regulator|nr:winged helix-turn-helix domain-containing protein [Acholeplasmataceae bacterium]
MKFETKYTDDKILEAIRKCLEEATVPASDVAEELGANTEYIKTRLKDMERRGVIKGRMKGRAWGFRPKNGTSCK